MAELRVFTVSVQPDGQQIQVSGQTNLLQALGSEGILLRADCGGVGRCGRCLVAVSGGSPSLQETRLSPACTVTVDQDLEVTIPPASRYPMETGSKSLDERALRDFLVAGDRTGRTAASGYGLAVDLGTTTIGLYLCDLAARQVLAGTAIRNPQVSIGLDVISRISAVRGTAGKLALLQKMAVSAIETGARSLLQSAAVPVACLHRLVVVGNPTMIHLLLGKDPSRLGQSPYAPAFTSARTMPARRLGFSLAESTTVHTPPLLSAFLGSDILASALAIDLAGRPEGTLLIDMGTNGELLLKGKTGCIATSCATGPAFEGSNLTCGMPAIPGAIDHIRLSDREQTIEASVISREGRLTAAEGICGSGAISGLAAFLRAGIVLPSGAFNPNCRHPALRRDRTPAEFVIVPGDDDRSAVTISQHDIRAVQLAKGALSCGVDMLCRHAAIKDPETILVAGAMGAHIAMNDCRDLGLFGAVASAETLIPVGNTAGLGAVMLLMGEGATEQLDRLLGATTVKNLSDWSDFQTSFVNRLTFPSR
jgi:uncharacterized 2Fe-2S/4Fe-4S cluster protein (DUF4445 family)